ncbi:MAG: hypothetical protein LBI02_12395 [Opitutaceae bacterium]|jgi:hypothetical protein|nr:hypothetical protein [Opitutaceae bacterium]
MPDLPYETLRDALRAQPLFEDKTWRLSPAAWPLTAAQAGELDAIGAACLEFHRALETLYLRSAAGKNLLRNKPLLAPWAADYLDRGKPAALVAHARDPRNRGAYPTVLRPDLLLTDEGFVMSELDSVPGGIGLTAFLNRLYAGPVNTPPAATTTKANTAAAAAAATEAPAATTTAAAAITATTKAHATTAASATATTTGILGADDAMLRHFHDSLAALRPDLRTPLIALVVSDEAAAYRPEMHWLARQLQLQGKRVCCLTPEELFPLGNTLCFDIEGNPEKIDILYRFFELFDLANLRIADAILESWHAGELAIAPPMRPFQEEKLGFALFHHHRLADFWAETLGQPTLQRLQKLIPKTWVLDPAPLPPGAVLEGPRVAGRALTDWRQLAAASQKERELVIKISGYHETAWGARGVVLGSDCSREEWQAGIDAAMKAAPANPHVLQEYKKPRRARHRVYDREQQPREEDGRLRLCPYYFNLGGQPVLSGALATFCPPDKKIIHGMTDAALLPCRLATG